MRNVKIFSLIIAVILVIGLVYAATMSVGNDFANVEGSEASGSFSVKVVETSRNPLQGVKMNLKFLDLFPGDDEVFEAWLVDEDTGYKLSLGAFTTNSRGKGLLRFNQKMVNFNIYDKVVITREQSSDTNPLPGETALVGIISSSEPNPIHLTAILNGAQEVPSTDSEGTGIGTFTVNTEDNTLSFTISYIGLSGDELAAHIHGPADYGEDADVLFPLPFGNPKVGVWNYDESQETNILNGMTYANIHSSVFHDGEIRGQIIAEE